jgi:Fur family ferric uptake transcriptional regulator
MSIQAKTRMTRQRKVILEELKKMKSHPSADELYLVVRSRLPRISLGTVYRNLQHLSRQGFVRVLSGASGQMLFDGDASEHYHVRCTNCGRVEDLPGRPILHFERDIVGETEYEILGYKIELMGICPDCKGKEKLEQAG